MKNAEKPILSISILASNRLDTIPRCLDSLTPIRQALPCELIIVDTSTDSKVRECLLEYTDIIIPFEWCNDFSKARNAGLKMAKGQWFMFLDDDEWFLDSEPIIQFFKTEACEKYGEAYYTVRNYKDESLQTYGDCLVKRLGKLKEGTEFKSKIHEYLQVENAVATIIDATAGHTGYIYKTAEDAERHFERNTSLLREMEKEEPNSLRWKCQYIQEFRSHKKWAELEAYCEKTIKYLHSQSFEVSILNIGQIYLAYINALLLTEKHNDAERFYKKCCKAKIFDNTFILRGYVNAYMTNVYYALEDFESAYERAKEYMESYDLYQKNPKMYEREQVGTIFHDAFSEKVYEQVDKFLFGIEFELEKKEYIAADYVDKKWEEMDAESLTAIQIKLLNRYVKREDYASIRKLLELNLPLVIMRPIIAQWLKGQMEEQEDRFLKVYELIRDIDTWRWYQVCVELFSLCEGGSEDNLRKILKSFILRVPNVFQIPNIVGEALQKQNIEIESLYIEIDFLTWKKHLAEHFACMNMAQLEELKERLSNSSLNQDVRYTYFMMLYAEQKVREAIEQINSGKGSVNVDYNELLGMFSYYTCVTYETLYGAELQSLEPEELPGNYQAALWLQIFFEEAEKDLDAALPCLEKVAEVYPFMKEFVEAYKKS